MAKVTKTENLEVINLAMYLELRNLNDYVASLLKKNHLMEFHTLTEWDSIKDDILNKKVKK